MELEQARAREQELEAEKNALETDLADLNEAYSNLVAGSGADKEEAVAEVKEALEQATAEKEALEKTLSERSDEVEKLMEASGAESGQLKVELEQARAREQELEAERNALELKIFRYSHESEMEELILANKNLEGDILWHEEANLTLASDLSSKKEAISDLESELKMKTDEILQLKASLSAVTLPMDSTKEVETVQRLDSATSNPKAEIEALMERLSTVESTLASKENDIRSRNLDISTLEAALENAVDEGQGFESALFVMESSSEAKQQEMEEALMRKDKEIVALSEEIFILKAKIAELENEVRELNIAQSLAGQPLEVQLNALTLSAAEKTTFEDSESDGDIADSSSCSTISSDDSGFQLN